MAILEVDKELEVVKTPVEKKKMALATVKEAKTLAMSAKDSKVSSMLSPKEPEVATATSKEPKLLAAVAMGWITHILWLVHLYIVDAHRFWECQTF